ncbi:hypothetical protein LguiB_035945 [Lonicera macranthoides]
MKWKASDAYQPDSGGVWKKRTFFSSGSPTFERILKDATIAKIDVLLLQYPWLEKGLDKAHITATSPEDQGHVKTEIPEALPLSHSRQFFLFKERGGRARFASSCPVKKKKVNKRKNKTQQNAQSTSGKQKTIEKRKKRGRAQSQRVRSSVPPFGNQMMRGSRLDDRVILYTPEKPSYSISFFLPSSSGKWNSPRFAKLMLQRERIKKGHQRARYQTGTANKSCTQRNMSSKNFQHSFSSGELVQDQRKPEHLFPFALPRGLTGLWAQLNKAHIQILHLKKRLKKARP